MVRALLTNDDGIASPGLAATRDALVSAGFEVLVVAPDGNRSATGHRVSIKSELTLVRTDGDAAGEWWSCTGTPADCVRMAFFTPSLPEFDLVVSGTNLGPNLGEDVFYSGTVAAAIEGSFLGKPALAVSQAAGAFPASFLAQSPDRFSYAPYVGRLAHALLEARGHLSRVIVNVNLPWTQLDDPSVELTRLGSRDWTTTGSRSARAGDVVTVREPWSGEPSPSFDDGTDFRAIREDRISITPLLVRGGLADLSAQWRTSSPVRVPGLHSPM